LYGVPAKMNAEPFDDKDGFRIWLDQSETETLLAAADRGEERTAFALGVRSGLRASEIVDVAAKDVVPTSAGPRVRVWNSKGKRYRETPTTTDILARADTLAELKGEETLLVDRSRQWVNRHLDDVTGRLADDDEMWRHVTPHDLRRTWATRLSAKMDDPLLVMDFGGWEDMETFLEHYRGTYSPAMQREELSKLPEYDVGRAGAERDPELAMLVEAVGGAGD